MRLSNRKSVWFIALLLLTVNNLSKGQVVNKLKIGYINYYFENGSPLLWNIENDTLLKISLLPDYQRQTLNRQTDHWYFSIVAAKGTRIRMTIEKMVPDVYNGRQATDWWNYRTGIPCYVSNDNESWTAYKTTTLPGRELYCDFVMESEEVWLARLPVYTTTHLNSLLTRIKGQNDVRILEIGRTLENRPLEIIQLGNPKAINQVVIRARAHPWEPGGNWVVEGLIEEFIKENPKRNLTNFCFAILPMANKDGVVRGMTRFNTAGMDLNRNWDKASDSITCPENYALEKYINMMIKSGLPPALVIDLHNDDKGDMHLAKRDKGDTGFQSRMQKLEKLMREHTSFSESFRYSWTGDGQSTVMTIDNGLYSRYGLEAFVYELNANRITGLNKVPSADDWKETGKGLLEVIYCYLEK